MVDGMKPGASGPRRGCRLAVTEKRWSKSTAWGSNRPQFMFPRPLQHVRFVKEVSLSQTIPKMDHLPFGDDNQTAIPCKWCR